MFKDELIEGFKNRKPLGKYYLPETCYVLKSNITSVIINKYFNEYFKENFFNKSFSSIKRNIKLYYDKDLLKSLEEVHKLGYIPIKVYGIHGDLFISNDVPLLKLEYEDKYKDILSIFFNIINSKISDLIYIYYYIDYIQNNLSSCKIIFLINKCKTSFLEEILISSRFYGTFALDYQELLDKYNIKYTLIKNKSQLKTTHATPYVSDDNFIKDIYNNNNVILCLSVLAKKIGYLAKTKNTNKMLMIDRRTGFKFGNLNYIFFNEDYNYIVKDNIIMPWRYSTYTDIYTLFYDNGKII